MYNTGIYVTYEVTAPVSRVPAGTTRSDDAAGGVPRAGLGVPVTALQLPTRAAQSPRLSHPRPSPLPAGPIQYPRSCVSVLLVTHRFLTVWGSISIGLRTLPHCSVNAQRFLLVR